MTNIYEPKNRKKESLPILEIRITSKEHTIIKDPNGICIMAATGNYPDMTPIPNLLSEISGKPAYKIEIDNLELHLSFEEMDRFFRHDLNIEEYKFLLNKYGMFHEIHEDFYWENEVIQPIEIAKKTILTIQSEKNKENLNITTEIIKKNHKGPKN